MTVINSQKAAITYDENTDMFRNEFVGLNGGADFYAKDIQGLHEEGETSLKLFLDMCKEDGVEPYKNFSGKFNVRIAPELHADVVAVAETLKQAINA